MGLSLGKAVLKTWAVADPAISYIGYRKEGAGVASSVGKAALEYAAWEWAQSLMIGLLIKDIAVAGVGIANSVGRGNAQISSKAYKANFGGHYQDSQNAYTMRQRGVQAIQNNGINARSVLGSEARQYFRGGY